jgi:tol-pal system protein YbgF
MVAALLTPTFFAFAQDKKSQQLAPNVTKQGKSIADIQARLTKLETTIEELKSQLNAVETKSHAMQNNAHADGAVAPSQQTDASSVDHVVPNQKESSTTFFEQDKKDPILALQSHDKQEYDIALAVLKEGRYDEAEGKFSDFLQKYPGSKLASNAMFWYAETFYHRSNYNKAAINYLKSYKHDSKGAKAGDSLLKLSFSLAGLNKNQEACSMLDKLESEFPNRPLASVKRARDARIKFGCP